MKLYYILAIILIFGVSAGVFGYMFFVQTESSPNSIVDLNPTVKLGQGIFGVVSVVSDNCMPRIVISELDGNSSCNSSVVSRNIYIRQPASMNNMNKYARVYLANQTKLIKQIKSNKQGEYRTELLPGKYSIFVERNEGYCDAFVDCDYNVLIDDDKEYCNSFGPYGESCLVTIKPGKFTQYDIKIDNAVW